VNAIPLGRRYPESEEETEARIWILHSDAAKVIGRGGRALREIENRTRTRIKVSKEEDMDMETKERSVDILGAREDQDAAVDYILDVVLYCRQDGGRVLKDSRHTPVAGARDGEAAKSESHRILTVLPEEVGKVLGRKGETIRVIEKESGAKVELDKAHGKVELFGNAEEQEKAVELLLAEVHWAKAEDGTVLKDEPRPKQRAEDEPELPPPMKIWVKDREAGRVIGRGGETVREVMEKSGSDIKVQKSDEMAPGSKERQIKIIGTKDQQDQALKLVLHEVSWARGSDGMLKGVEDSKLDKDKDNKDKEKDKEAKAPDSKEVSEPVEDEKEKVEKEASAAAAKVKPRRFQETARERNRPKSGPARWVCATCGGDHRTKECPHATGILGVGVQLGMQMGLQAMGLPPGAPPGPMGVPFGGMPMGPGMGMPMGPPGMPMGGPAMPMLGMPPMLPPGMRPPGLREPSQSSSSSSSGSPGSEEEEEPPDAGSPGEALPERPRRRVRKRKGPENGVPAGVPQEHRRRRRRRRVEGETEMLVPVEAPDEGASRRRRPALEEKRAGGDVPPGKKKIVMSDL